MALPEGLLKAVKNYLSITFDDVGIDEKITGIISRGMDYLDKIAGKEQDYSVEGIARGLLMDYVLYVNSLALSEFSENYRQELIWLQIHAQEVNPDDTESD